MDKHEAYVDAAAAALGLPIADEYRAEVLMYFRLAAGMAEQLQSVVLGPADESGSVFTPVSAQRTEAGQ